MAENYKHLYEQTKKMLAMYQDEIVPGFRKLTDSIVQCGKCANSDTISCSDGMVWCKTMCRYMKEDGFCSFGERKDNG